MKKVLYGVLGLLTLLSLFILACIFQPELAGKVSDLLYADRGSEENRNEDNRNEENQNNENRNEESRTGESGNETGTTGTAGQPSSGNHNGGTDASGAGPQNMAASADTQGEGGADGMEGLTSDEVLGLNGSAVRTGQGNGTQNHPDAAQKERERAAEGVAGRGGYVPVQGETEQVDDKEAEKLKEQYTYGETGEGLTFDSEFYPYYDMLDGDQQALYRQVYANAMAVNGIFNPVKPVSQGQLKNVFMAVFNDHPELFWLDSAYRGKFDRRGECVEIVLEFNRLIDDLDAAKAAFHAEAEKIIAQADRLGTDYEVEVFVHNALLDKIVYDLRAPLNQSAYSGMVNGKTVCAGYARSFQYLMMELGIPCYYCTGYAGEAHAWNIVKLDGEYYNADATWDDTDPNTYDYFNKPDAEFNANHRREDLSVNLPPCNGTRYSNRESSPRNAGTDSTYGSARFLEEAGFREEDVLLSLDEYYEDCYNQIMANGGSCTFQNVVDGENLWMQCYNAYNSDAYSGGYMDRVFADLGAAGCNVDIEAELLRDGRFLLHHTVEFRY